MTSLEKFSQDPQLSLFLSSESDSVSLASQSIARLSATSASPEAMVASLSSELSLLSKGVALIDSELNAQVATNHESLLEHVSAIKELEQTLGLVTTGVDALQQSIDRIKQEITEPFRVIQLRTRQLERIHICAEMLRRVLRFVQHARRLRAHVAKADLAKAAQSYRALQELLAADDLLRGVHAVEQHRAWLATTGDDIRERAAQLLLRGVDAQHQADTATALQVFLNLGSLQLRVTACYDGVLRRVRDAVDRMFEHDAAAADDVRAALWLRFEAVQDALHDGVVQIHHLHGVLLRRRDPQTHRTLASALTDAAPGKPPLTVRFWHDAVALLDARVKDATGSSSEVLDAFIVDYARALRQLHEVLRRVRGHFQAKRVRAPLSEADGASLLAIVARFRTPYLQRSWERLYAEAQSAFGVAAGADQQQQAPPQRVPSAQQILRFVKAMADELDQSAVAADVALAVGKGVARSVKYFAGAAEALVDVSPDAHRIDGSEPSKGGKRNTAVFAALLQLHSSSTLVLRSFGGGDAEATAPLAASLQAVFQLADQIVEPLFAKFTKVAEATILDIHRANYARAEGTTSAAAEQPLECSAFVRALQNHVDTFRSHTLARFGASELLSQRCLKLTHRLLEFFVRHACLVRPLGRGGRLQMAADMAQFEAGVAPLISENAVGVEALRQFGGAPYKRLRRLRPALFDSAAKLVAAAREGALGATHALHLLFGMAPDALVSPHRAMQWTIGRYSLFLDESSDAVVWQLIDEHCLRPFAAGAGAADPIVVAMREIGEFISSS